MLIEVQAANDRNRAIVSSEVTDIPLSSIKLLTSYDVPVSEGSGIIADAMASYKHTHELTDQDAVPTEVAESIALTAHTYIERERANGDDGQVQPGEQLSLTEIEDPDGHTWTVVSDTLQLDTN